MKKRRNAKSRKPTRTARSPKRKVEKVAASQKSAIKGSLKDRMLSILTRGRGETLGSALSRAGLSTTLYYYYLRRANFGMDGRKRQSKVSLSSADAKRLGTLIKRHERLQGALNKFRAKVL